MPLTEQQQINIKKFFLTILKEAIAQKNTKQSVISDHEADNFRYQTKLSRADAKTILNGYQQASNSTKVFASRAKLNFEDTENFLQTYIANELTPLFRSALQENQTTPTEKTPLSISNAPDAKLNIIINTIAQLESQLPSDDFYEKYKIEIEQAKKALIVTGIGLGIAALVGLTIYAGFKVFSSDSSEPSQAPSFHG